MSLLRFAPSLFLSARSSLYFANCATASRTPASATFFRNFSGSSHLLPNADALSVSVSFVCRQRTAASS